jgi:peptidyl-prolyl cis-trans isomerase B (cyclophilin B)
MGEVGVVHPDFHEGHRTPDGLRHTSTIRVMLKRALVGVPALVLLLGLAACGEDDNEPDAGDESSPTSAESPTAESPTGESDDSGSAGDDCAYVPDGTGGSVEPPPAEVPADLATDVTMQTSIGDFAMTLDPERAPCTVNSFVSLVEQGFFDGTSCHRMTISDLFKVLQCGDPTGSGTGGPGYTIPGEFDGTETYAAGTLAMARSTDPDSGGSQFFIVYGDTALNPEYTVFGTVDQATIDAIDEASRAGVVPQMSPEDGAPKTPIDIESASVG